MNSSTPSSPHTDTWNANFVRFAESVRLLSVTNITPMKQATAEQTAINRKRNGPGSSRIVVPSSANRGGVPKSRTVRWILELSVNDPARRQ
jgi:hypothetical protein